MIKELKPKVPTPPSTPQCQAAVDPPSHNQMWRRDRFKRLRPNFDPDKCQRVSCIKIDGKTYCRLHAAEMALERWLRGSLVESTVTRG